MFRMKRSEQFWEKQGSIVEVSSTNGIKVNHSQWLRHTSDWSLFRDVNITDMWLGLLSIMVSGGKSKKIEWLLALAFGFDCFSSLRVEKNYDGDQIYRPAPSAMGSFYGWWNRRNCGSSFNLSPWSDKNAPSELAISKPKSFQYCADARVRQLFYREEISKFTFEHRRIHREEGIRGLWRGLGPNLIGVIPARCVRYLMISNSGSWIISYR